MTELTTERLHLRPVTEGDLDEFHEIFSDPQAMQYWSTPPHEKISQTTGLIKAMIGSSSDFGEDFVVTFEGRLIGKAGFWKFPEIGYIFHPDYWGKGMAKEALTAVLDYGFRELNLEYVVADIDPRNTRSIHLLEGLGFRETGRENNTIKVGDTWCDSVYYALENPDFEN